jgi:hypothetical protein
MEQLRDLNMIRTSRHLVIILTCVLFFTIVFVSVLSCKAEESNRLFVDADIHVTDINLQNHTVTADITFEIHGLKPLIVEGSLQEPRNILFTLDDMDFDVVSGDCQTDENGTCSAYGFIKGTNWYLSTKGEGYPFDMNLFVFGLANNNILYSINGTNYVTYIQLNYVCDWINQSIDFRGINTIDYENTWHTRIQVDGQQFYVLLNRNGDLGLYLTLIPQFFLIGLAIVVSNISVQRKNKIEFFTAILVFAPMFIFSIQTFIPPRISLAIPEFLAILLIILSSSMIMLSFLNVRKIWIYLSEIAIFSGLLIFEAYAIFNLPNFSILMANISEIWFVFGTVEAFFIIGILSHIKPLRHSLREYTDERKEMKRKRQRTCSGWDGDC